MSRQPPIRYIPDSGVASDRDPAAAIPPRTAVRAAHDDAALTVDHTMGRGVAASDVAAALTDITSGVLAVVAAARYAGISWAGDRWLAGRAPIRPTAATLDALRATLGHGPSLRALCSRDIVTIADLGSETRWPEFAARVTELGVGSMLSLPLSVRHECFGVLNLYATRPHAFTDGGARIAAQFAARAGIALYRAAERDHVQIMARRDAIERATDRTPNTDATTVRSAPSRQPGGSTRW